MLTAADRRPEFTPPPEPGLLRSVSLAIGAHALLVLALSWGIDWKRQDDNAVVEAELWSSTVREAAPKPVEPPPAPPPAPVVQPPPQPAPVQRDAEIALERERERKAAEAKRQEEADRRKQQEAAQRKQELEKRELARKATEDRKREEQAKLAREKKQQEELLEKMRKENMDRMAGMAGATGSPSSSGTAQQSSGPSSSYAGRVRARVKPNIVFTDNISGNPTAEIEVRLSPDGTIVGRKLSKPSGVASWDEAVLRAIDRTERFPRDVDGRVPTSMILVFRPKDL